MALKVRPGQLRLALRNLKRGERLCYFRGDLFGARIFDAAVHQVGKEAWSLYVRGQALLVQQRHGDDDYSYCVVKL